MTTTPLRPLCLSLVFMSIAGCGGQVGYDQPFENQLDSVTSDSIENAAGREDAELDGVRLVSESGEIAAVRRRIVYDSELTLIVVSYSEFESKIVKLVDLNDGFIAKSETNRRYEDRQSGTWVARIPVANYSRFLSAAVELGFPESRVEEAQDITAEYVDVEARIKNNQKLETRILELLANRLDLA